MPFTLLQNLKLTIPTTLGFAIAGYVVSLPLSFLVDRDAALYKFKLYTIALVRGIEIYRINDVGKFQVGVLLGSAVLGVVVAQTTFVAKAIAAKHSSD